MSEPSPLPIHAASLPAHIAIIMDGNGRWAKKRGLPRYKGHIEGAKTFRRIGEFAGDLGISCLTFYAFSTENWKRPPEEVAAIMDLFREYLRELDDRKAENEEKGIKVNFIGDRTGIPQDILRMMGYSERITRKKDHVILNIAINYGGRQEILRAAQTLAQRVKDGQLEPQDITQELFEDCLYTRGQKDPDFILRPSGEMRLSNFMLWQASYSEFISMDVLWPDFRREDLDRALQEFQKRSRRFGGL